MLLPDRQVWQFRSEAAGFGTCPELVEGIPPEQEKISSLKCQNAKRTGPARDAREAGFPETAYNASGDAAA